ncbi:MAG: AAA family ATPase [Lachnospiraceae bacterium]
MNRWIVHIKNFGKIEEADVEVAPLTLFVGDNNSGKSYIMSLIYGLLSVRFFFDGYVVDEDSQIFQQCCSIIEKMIPEQHTTNEYVLSEKEINQLQQLINQVLKNNKQKFLMNLFNREMEIEELRVEFPKHMRVIFEVRNVMDAEKNQDVIMISQKTANNSQRYGYQESRDKLKKGEVGYWFLLSYIMESMLYGEMGTPKRSRRVYLPTTRTGFLLTYKTLIGSAVQEKFTLEETGKNLLTKPNSDFLKELGSMDTSEESGLFQELINFIENHVITGHISVSDTPAQDFAYTPEGSEQKLPLYVTSGVVTEMTPLLLFLKYVNIGALLFEEPEVSLHPQLQWQVARVLVQLTNMGIPVFVTTHSDIILQHINNMIKANEMKDKDAFLKHSDYKEQDLLFRNQVRVYQFDVQESQVTNVHRLPCGDYGFEAMTFYDTLEKINLEILQIENEA